MNSYTTDQVREFFDAHWTVRKYKSFTIPQDHLDTILYAAQRAPTDATAQMYTIIRLSDSSLKKRMAELTKNAHVESASESFIMCADVNRLSEILKVHQYEPGHFPSVAVHFAIGDIVMAGQNLLTAAEMLGYRGCWIGGVLSNLEEISSTLKLPNGVFPFAALTIGVPDEDSKHRPRLPRSEVVHENFYKTYDSEVLKQAAIDMAAITMRGDWPQTLNGYFGKGGAMEQREKSLKNLLSDKLNIV